MKPRAIGVLTTAAVAVAMTAAVLTEQTATSPDRNRRIWFGSVDARDVAFNLHDETPAHRPVRFFSDVHVDFLYQSVDDPTHPSGIRWTERTLVWRGTASSASSITGVDCDGRGLLHLEPAQGVDEITPAEEAKLKIPCKSWDKAINWALIRLPHPTVPLPKIDTNMPTCGPERRWSENGVRYTLGVVGGDTKGAFRVENVDTPFPGHKYRIRGWSNVLGRWRFVVESSRLRGYATNADIDASFFQLYPDVGSLGDRYRTMDPDLVFDPGLAEEQGSEWKPPTSDSGPRKWSVLESKEETSVNRVDAELTAMDFGAHGELRAFFSPSCSDGSAAEQWMPVPVDGAGGATVVKIPKDEDGNFISDDEADYRGLAALSDEDSEPIGDGTAGDGFTAFEEYRGFVQSTQPSCESALRVRHERTSPKLKDLFAHPSDPLLWKTVYDFYITSDLEVHTICPPQYAGNDTRVVNFTMHSISGPAAVGAGFRGARLTQAQPQHGLYVVNERPGGDPRILAHSDGFGPPGGVNRISINVEGIRTAYGASALQRFLYVITHHELGHAVGIRHHGDGNIAGPVVLLNTPGCIVGMVEGTVEDQPACQAKGIAVRGQQNSGNQFCPMKYLHWDWYVPRGGSTSYMRSWLTFIGEVDFRPDTPWGWRRPSVRLKAYEGRVYRYRKDLDRPPERDAMRLCANGTGTGINALPMDQNHAGDADRTPSCSRQLRVNDVGVAPGSSR